MLESLPTGWLRVPADRAQDFETELHRELSPGHVLYDQAVAAVAYGAADQDDVIFRLADRGGYAVVHLTWTKETSTLWPYCTVHDNLGDLEAEDGHNSAHMPSRLLVLAAGGLGPFRFGLTPGQVRLSMNEPELYEDWMGGNLNDALLYRGLIFGFDECNAQEPQAAARLIEVTIRGRAEVVFGGRPLWNWTIDDLAAYLPSLGRPLVPRPGGIDVPDLGLWFTFTEGRIDEAGVYETVEARQIASSTQKFWQSVSLWRRLVSVCTRIGLYRRQ